MSEKDLKSLISHFTLGKVGLVGQFGLVGLRRTPKINLGALFGRRWEADLGVPPGIPQGQAGAFGAKVRIYPTDANSRTSLLGFREAGSNYGYLGQDDPVLHFGLGRHHSVNIVVVFPDGTEVTMSDVSANRIVTIDGVRANR